MKKIIGAILAIVLISSTASCATQTPFVKTKPEKVSAALQPFYSQNVQWNDCGSKLLCAQIKVPLNWKKPNIGDAIKLSVVNHLAANPGYSGYLFTNPGGPGASGYDFIHDSISQIATDSLISSYNIVGFDPRGSTEAVR